MPDGLIYLLTLNDDTRFAARTPKGCLSMLDERRFSFLSIEVAPDLKSRLVYARDSLHPRGPDESDCTLIGKIVPVLFEGR
jgi:hypothetical protein